MENVHISQIKAGDTILFNGVATTVCGKDIKYCSFMGITLFGSNYKSGTELVQRMSIQDINEYQSHIFPKVEDVIESFTFGFGRVVEEFISGFGVQYPNKANVVYYSNTDLKTLNLKLHRD